MLLERRLRPPRRVGIDLAALEPRPLEEDRGDRRRDLPAAMACTVVEQGAIGRRRRQELDPREARQVHAEAARILEEELRVRLAGDQAAGLLLVQVLRQLATRLV